MALIHDPVTEKRCRTLVDDLALPHPCTLEALVQTVAESQNLIIDLQARDFSDAPSLSAMLVRTQSGYAIHYHHSADYWWMLTCVSHELGHVLGRHPLMPRDPALEGDLTSGFRNIEAYLPDMQEALSELGPLFRCQEPGPIESEAEFIASLLVQRIETTRSSSLSIYLLGTRGPDVTPHRLLNRLRRRRA